MSWHNNGEEFPFRDLVGKTFKEIDGADAESGQIYFWTTEGEKFEMFHDQDCCEIVQIEEIHGDINDLIGEEILEAEEVVSDYMDEKGRLKYEVLKAAGKAPYMAESNTWTFYKLRSRKGGVTIRWHGSSNGYYSERVSFERINPK